ncbi:MAG: glycosyltransferase family 2 protein [Deltaproteobacteria bacterium]|nr:glycosyltransferase family 2 protein [Deltaproteobacteria bacterium]
MAGLPPAAPLVSLVMIARDEESCLPRALASARDWVDEIVLVDTGSADRTREIARAYGARVYEHPWRNDFSLHRNQALGYATGAWCLQLDADEELDQSTGPLLRRLAGESRAAAHRVEIVNLHPGGRQMRFAWPRFFRRQPGVYYHRPVHNLLEVPGPVADSGLRLFHHGYAGDPATLEKKHARRLAMMRRWVAEEPGDWAAHRYLSQALLFAPAGWEEAVAEGRRAGELARAAGAPPGALALVEGQVVQGLILLGRYAEAAQRCPAWAALVPASPDPHYCRGQSLYALGRDAEAARSLEEYARLCHLAAADASRLAGLEVFSLGHLPMGLTMWLATELRLGRQPRARQVQAHLAAQPVAPDLARQLTGHLAGRGLAAAARDLAAAWGIATGSPGPGAPDEKNL